MSHMEIALLFGIVLAIVFERLSNFVLDEQSMVAEFACKYTVCLAIFLGDDVTGSSCNSGRLLKKQ